MSSNRICSFFVIVALLYATVNPLAHALFFNQENILTVSGRVCCTNNGNCLAGSLGIATAPATLSCPIVGTVATAITDADGNFVFSTVNLRQFASPSLCNVFISLPLISTAATSCSLLATGSGSIVGPVVVTSSTGGGFFNLFGGTRIVTGTVVVFVRKPL